MGGIVIFLSSDGMTSRVCRDSLSALRIRKSCLPVNGFTGACANQRSLPRPFWSISGRL